MKLNLWKHLTAKHGLDTVGFFAELLDERVLGTPMSAGALTMIPVFRSAVREDLFAAPEDALMLERVARYGTMIFKNKDERPAIIPMQLGYLQKEAQNHAMCVAGLLAPKSSATFTDACCVQQAQGGLIVAHDERFIVLPHPLRSTAFALRGQNSYSKLWKAITAFNQLLGLKARGHLDDLKHEYQPQLLRISHQLELLDGQTGAIFLFNGMFVGLELAPDAAFWAQLHTALVMFGYAPLTLISELVAPESEWKIALDVDGVTSLVDLRLRLADVAERRKVNAFDHVKELAVQAVRSRADASVGDAQLLTLEGEQLAGQAVLHDGAPAYASVFSLSRYFAVANSSS